MKDEDSAYVDIDRELREEAGTAKIPTAADVIEVDRKGQPVLRPRRKPVQGEYGR